jgi:dTDP-4-dehydrorhamnose reductase
MMGGGAKDHKLVSLIVKEIVLGSIKEINAVNDKFGMATYTRDFARGLLRILESAPPGLYHQVCHGSASRYEAAQEIARYFGPEIKVNSVNSEFFERTYFASRPEAEQLINFELQNLGLDVMNDCNTSLREYLPELIEAIRIMHEVE